VKTPVADHETSGQGPGFIHLRVRSAYSLLQGALPVDRLVELANADQMPALAITDTGNLFGALELAVKLSKGNVQPIIGCSIQIDFDNADETSTVQDREQGPLQHDRSINRIFPELALIAMDEAGYKNLLQLSSRAFLGSDGAGMAHITMGDLEAFSSGIIALTGGAQGLVGQHIIAGDEASARATLVRLGEIFPDRLYVELQRHAMDSERKTEPVFVDMAYELSLPLVATNDCQFPTSEDFEAHDALQCIAQGTVVDDANRPRLTLDHYFKSRADMLQLFADLPEATDNTVEIAKRCHYWPEPSDPVLPSFSDGDEDGELRKNAEEGLRARLKAYPAAPGHGLEEYLERLKFELDVIVGMNYSGYFLIVADFIKWAKGRDIPVGPGRGSGAGSLVAWALTITDLDPIRFDLLFERFLNPERVSMPDFDIDFCQERRDEVIDYVRERYGAGQVAQIITFGTLQSRIVLRDVGRVLQMRYSDVDALCKMIPNNPANPVNLSQAIAGEARIQEARANNPQVAKLLEISLRLEGLYRHASTHAAGLVIGDRPLVDVVPLYLDPRSDIPATQFSMKWVEAAGLVKFDFLGLKTLTVIDKTVKALRKRDINLDITALPLDDEATYKMLAEGETVGVFQLESAGMRDLLRGTMPSVFEDIIALVALFRPGPMQNIPKYRASKLGEEKPEFLHETIVPVVEDTYGVIIYQEQVMKIAQVFSGFTLGEADLLRRAMGKKDQAEMTAQKTRFVDGAVERGVGQERAEYVFELVDRFAGYGFNKSHSACYALVAYQTAYLKANYPVEFFAASMTLDLNNTDKLNDLRGDTERLGIEILPPSVNASGVDFLPENGAIRYSLAAIRNVGRQAVAHISECREEGGAYKNLTDFASRINPRHVNRRALENMAAAGAFDELMPNRAAVFEGADIVMATAARNFENQISGQNDLFAGSGSEISLDLPAAEPWLPVEQLNHEFQALGLFLSGHPLQDYLPTFKTRNIETWREFCVSVAAGKTAGKLAGIVLYKKERRSQKGSQYAFIGLSDPSGQYEVVIFSEALADCRANLEAGKMIQITVEAEERDGGEIKARINTAAPIDQSIVARSGSLKLYLEDTTDIDGLTKRLPGHGNAQVTLVVFCQDRRREIDIRLPGSYDVTPEIAGALKAFPGVLDVAIN
jgi:DNA polymerase III subunit alpha